MAIRAIFRLRMKLEKEDTRVRQVVIGGLILALMAVLAGVVVIGCHQLPGVFGEWVAMMVGLMTTPVFLEISAFVVGLMVVLLINHWREKREGPDLVELEVPGAAGDDQLRK